MLLSLFAAMPGFANDKCGHHENAYNKGMKDGKHDAENYRSSDAQAGQDKVAKDGRHCYIMGYEDAYTKVAREQIKSNNSSGHKDHHGHGSSKSSDDEYFEMGCRKGRRDGENRMSMAYERHSDDYDSRCETAYRLGYERCWKESR